MPFDKIRDGYYTDAYFNLSKELLEAEGRHPRVTMQVFQKGTSILGGIDEAIAVLRLCAGRRLADGSWGLGWDQLDVRALHEGDEVDRHARSALDEAGHQRVKIVCSGGFDTEKIREFEAAGATVDSYGVGSSLLRGQTDFTADVVCLEGAEGAKAARRYRPNPRLDPVP